MSSSPTSPPGNLDSQTGREIVDLLEQLNAAGQTIVMVTHNLEIARRARRLFLMRDGEIDEVDPATLAGGGYPDAAGG